MSCALIAVLPLAIYGNSCGHDFDFHLQSGLAVAQQWPQGIFYPHWIEAANYGAGEPRFVFYPPISWALGALLGSIFSFAIGPALAWKAAPIAFILIALAASGLAMRKLARRWMPADAATLAACAYVLNPYILFVAYERGAYGELAAGVWLPLLVLYAIYQACLPQKRHPGRSAEGAQSKDLRLSPDSTTPSARDPAPSLSPGPDFETRVAHNQSPAATLIPLSLVVAAIWLTNAPAAVMACYSLAAIALWTAVAQRQWQPLLKSAASVILGLGLASFYLVPAAYERRWVEIGRAIGPGMRIEDSFLFGHTGEAFHDQVLRTASWIFVTMFATIFAAGFIAWKRQASKILLKALFVTAAVLFALQLPWSRPFWTHAPELKFLQFPWRWSLVLALPFAFSIGAIVACSVGKPTKDRPRRFALQAAVVLVAAIAIAAAATHLFRQPCDEEDAVSAQLALFHSGSGFEGTDEYTTLGADNSLIQQNLPLVRVLNQADAETATPASTAAEGEDQGNPAYQPIPATHLPARVQIQSWQPERKQFTVATQEPGYAVLRLMDYPAWQILANQTAIVDRPHREDGLISVPIQRGLTRIDIRYAATPDVLSGRALSAASLVALLAIGVSRRRMPPNRLPPP